MPSATKLADQKGGGSGANLIHGSDLKKTTLTVRVQAAREAPQTFSSPVILDIEEPDGLPGKQAVALNATNTRTLAEILGDEIDDWAGATVTFTRIKQRNPKTGDETWGLAVTDAKPYKSRGKAKSKAAPVSKSKPQTSDEDDVPF